MTKDVEYFFRCFLAIWVSLGENYLFSSVPHVLIGLFGSLESNILSFFVSFVLDISPVLGVGLVNSFPNLLVVILFYWQCPLPYRSFSILWGPICRFLILECKSLVFSLGNFALCPRVQCFSHCPRRNSYFLFLMNLPSQQYKPPVLWHSLVFFHIYHGFQWPMILFFFLWFFKSLNSFLIHPMTVSYSAWRTIESLGRKYESDFCLDSPLSETWRNDHNFSKSLILHKPSWINWSHISTY